MVGLAFWVWRAQQPEPVAEPIIVESQPIAEPVVVEKQPTISQPQITILQGIPRAATVLVMLPPELPELVWITAEAKAESLHIRYGDFHEELTFKYPVWINYYEYRDRQMSIDLTIETEKGDE